MTIEEFKNKVAPYMNNGWVAMNMTGEWLFFTEKPEEGPNSWISKGESYSLYGIFQIDMIIGWKKSLIKVGF